MQQLRRVLEKLRESIFERLEQVEDKKSFLLVLPANLWKDELNCFSFFFFVQPQTH